MAIQPIDLQTLFTQVDKVGRAQLAAREGVAVQQAIQGAELQRRTEEQIQAVNETQNTGDDGAEKIKDRGPQGDDGGKEKKKQARQADEEQGGAQTERQTRFYSDPRLGRNIDISL